MTRNGLAAVNGTHLAYEERGNGAPLVLINPGAFDYRIWDDVVDALAGVRRVIRYDPRGWGRSGDVTAPFSPLQDLEALLEHPRVERADVLGASWGAALAIDFAVSRPEKVRVLILLGAAPAGSPIPPDVIESFRPIVMAMRTEPEGGVDLWLDTPGVGFPGVAPALRARVRSLALENTRYWALDPRHLLPLLPPARERLESLTAPTLVITGEREQPFWTSAADELTARLASGRRGVIAGAGHLAHLSNPAGFLREVLPFLTGAGEVT